MLIWVGVVSHRDGRNIYAGATPEDVEQQVAEYCLEYWDVEKYGPTPEASASDDDVITTYFEAEQRMWPDETYDLDEVELRGFMLQTPESED